MLLTEEEARKKTCPYMTYCVNPEQVLQDHYPALYCSQDCMASDCMAWGWGDKEEVGPGRKGYCGLAPKPAYD